MLKPIIVDVVKMGNFLRLYSLVGLNSNICKISINNSNLELIDSARLRSGMQHVFELSTQSIEGFYVIDLIFSKKSYNNSINIQTEDNEGFSEVFVFKNNARFFIYIK